MARQTLPPLAVVTALGVTQTIGYGTLYYAFGVLTGSMTADTGLSLTWIYGLFAAGQLAGGAVAPYAGRLLDRVDPAGMMAAGSFASAIALTGWALTPGWIAFAAFVMLVQVASVVVFYESAFVVAARLSPARARRTITGITLIAGFASTIFWPLTSWLTGFLDWRAVYLIYAVLNGAICAPLHLWLMRPGSALPQPTPGSGAPPSITAQGRITDPARRRKAFVITLVSFSCASFVFAAIHLHLIGLLGALGLAGSAALIGALIGPAQVAGRLIEFAAGDRIDVVHVSIFSAIALPVGLLALVTGAPGTLAAIVFVMVFGVGQGLNYIVRGVLPLELFGRDGYGALMGKIGAVRLVLAAAAPFVAAALFERFGAIPTLWTITAVGATGAVALLLLVALLRAKPTS